MLRMSAVLVVAALTHPAAKADDYYVAIFSGETVPFDGEKTHSFVAAVRVPTGGGVVEMTSISWLPANLIPRGLTLRRERGVNLGIPETVAWAKGLDMRVSVWGPYRIEKELFCRIKKQAAILNSGRVKYKPTDNLAFAWRVQNCYHALWMPVAPLRARGPSGPLSAGDAASADTVQYYSPWILDKCGTYDFVFDLIGVRGAELCRRAYDDRPGGGDALRSFLRR